jgi:hypothetical protein
VGSILGTAAYLSPEQARGDEARPASDIYSLGVCAYQFLTGRLPHEYASLTELALKQQQDPVAPVAEYRPEVPPALDRAVRLSLEPEPGHRYASALDMAEALEAGLHGESTEVTRRLSEEEAYEATRALDDTAATRAMAATRVVPPGPPARARPPAEPAERRASRDDARRGASRRRWGTFLALLAVLAAIAVVAVALSSSSGGGVDAPNSNDVEQQIQQLRDFIQENTR